MRVLDVKKICPQASGSGFLGLRLYKSPWPGSRLLRISTFPPGSWRAELELATLHSPDGLGVVACRSIPRYIRRRHQWRGGPLCLILLRSGRQGSSDGLVLVCRYAALHLPHFLLLVLELCCEVLDSLFIFIPLAYRYPDI